MNIELHNNYIVLSQSSVRVCLELAPISSSVSSTRCGRRGRPSMSSPSHTRQRLRSSSINRSTTSSVRCQLTNRNGSTKTRVSACLYVHACVQRAFMFKSCAKQAKQLCFFTLCTCLLFGCSVCITYCQSVSCKVIN